jgi:hypothetical protein
MGFIEGFAQRCGVAGVYQRRKLGAIFSRKLWLVKEATFGIRL